MYSVILAVHHVLIFVCEVFGYCVVVAAVFESLGFVYLLFLESDLLVPKFAFGKSISSAFGV